MTLSPPPVSLTLREKIGQEAREILRGRSVERVASERRQNEAGQARMELAASTCEVRGVTARDEPVGQGPEAEDVGLGRRFLSRADLGSAV